MTTSMQFSRVKTQYLCDGVKFRSDQEISVELP